MEDKFQRVFCHLNKLQVNKGLTLEDMSQSSVLLMFGKFQN